MSKKCKMIDKCKKCQCCKTQAVGLADKLSQSRPPDRIVERKIVEIATRCEPCGCTAQEEAENAREES